MKREPLKLKEYPSIIFFGVIAICGAMILFAFGGLHYLATRGWKLLKYLAERAFNIYAYCFGWTMGYFFLGIAWCVGEVFFKEHETH